MILERQIVDRPVAPSDMEKPIETRERCDSNIETLDEPRAMPDQTHEERPCIDVHVLFFPDSKKTPELLLRLRHVG